MSSQEPSPLVRCDRCFIEHDPRNGIVLVRWIGERSRERSPKLQEDHGQSHQLCSECAYLYMDWILAGLDAENRPAKHEAIISLN